MRRIRLNRISRQVLTPRVFFLAATRRIEIDLPDCKSAVKTYLKMVDEGDVAVRADPSKATEDPRISDIANVPSDCDVVLDSMDECVGCVEGVDMQHRFEERLLQQAAQQRKVASEHGISEAEAMLIRMQIIDEQTISSTVGHALPQLDVLNVCGNGWEIDDACVGVVSPKDTTLQTTEPGDKLMDTTDKSARSLVDVAADDEASVERPFGDGAA